VPDDKIDQGFEQRLAGELGGLADEATRPFDAAEISRAAIGRASGRGAGPANAGVLRAVAVVSLVVVVLIGAGVVGGFIKLPNNDLRPNPSYQPFSASPNTSTPPFGSPSPSGALPPTVVPVTPSTIPLTPPPTSMAPTPTPTPTPTLAPTPSLEPSPSPTFMPTPTPTPARVHRVVALAAGYHDCFVADDGRIFCDGTNDSGELGDGTTDYRDYPNLAVVGINDATSVAVGLHSSCATRSTGTVWCWGQALGSTNVSRVPLQVPGIDHATSVVMGQDFACALRDDGTVWCWGQDWFGQLGNGSTAQVSFAEPQQAIGVSTAVQIAAGHIHACALLADGTVSCWGDNGFGQLGDGTQELTGIPTAVVGIDNALEVRAGGWQTCAIGADRSVWCWGNNDQGQLGDGDTAYSLVPVQVQTIDDAQSLAVGFHHACAVRSDATIWCWGDTAWASSDGAPALTPIQAPKEGVFRAALLATATQNVLAIDNRGKVWNWGFGTNQSPERWPVGP
jgi:alpha-tubulin suppressor-like RCC1 family protein